MCTSTFLRHPLLQFYVLFSCGCKMPCKTNLYLSQNTFRKFSSKIVIIRHNGWPCYFWYSNLCATKTFFNWTMSWNMSYFVTIIASNKSFTLIVGWFNKKVFIILLLLSGLKPIPSLFNDTFCVPRILFKFSSPFENFKTTLQDRHT